MISRWKAFMWTSFIACICSWTLEASDKVKCDDFLMGQNGHSYETALLLSVFLGMFGIDRFYLGYPAIGLLKFCTLGFFFVLHLVDVILIATQVVGPADGSEYIIDYYGPKLTHVTRNNNTFYIQNH